MRSGRYQASFIGIDDSRHYAPTTFAVKTSAESWLADEHREMERCKATGALWLPPAIRAQHTSAGMLTLAEYGKTWLEQRKLKDSTRREYTRIFDALITPELGMLPLRAISVEIVQRWYSHLDPETPTRTKHAYSLLHAICATALRANLIDRQPCAVEGAMNAPSKRVPVILDAAEIAPLAKAMPENLGALILIAAWCGLRWGEVTELRRGDIGPGCATLTVARAATHRGGCVVDTPKSGRWRTVTVPAHIQTDLKHHMDTYVAPGNSALLFPAKSYGCHLNETVFRRSAFHPALKAIGRDGVARPRPVIHDLRHFAGTMAAQAGATMKETMDRLGHSTTSAALRYQHTASGRAAEVADALSVLAQAATAAQAKKAG